MHKHVIAGLASATLLSGLALVTAVPAGAGSQSFSGPTVTHNTDVIDFSASTITVRVNKPASGRTVVTLHVKGAPAAAYGRTFGAHVHKDLCGADAAASGGHYQRTPTGAGPDLHDAEVWLDFTVDAEGNGSAQANVDWSVTSPDAESVVIHEVATNPTTGGAMKRLACTDVDFGA